jgi:hypothetical protein
MRVNSSSLATEIVPRFEVGNDVSVAQVGVREHVR